MKIPLEAYITSSYVKYDRLASLIAEAFAGYDDTYLDIYIDMNSVIKALYNSQYNTGIDNYKSLTACIINMCGHYRDYFRRYLGVNTDIIIVMSNNICDINRKYVAEYNKSFRYKIETNNLINNLVKDNLDLLNSLIPYIPNIYMIQSEFETAAVISSIINKRRSEGIIRPNLLISRDLLSMQVVAKYNKTAMLRPMKNYNGDNSYIVGPLDNQEFIDKYWYFFDKEITDGKTSCNINIHPINTSLLMALNRYNKRDLKTIVNITQAKKYIYKCVEDNPVRCSVKTVFELNPELNDKVSWTTVESRHKALDIDFQQTIYENSLEYKLLNFIDLNNPTAVKRVNDEIFYDNPIDIDRL